ncbi:MAG: ferritin family protein [Deltaproteobacteria bacterium]|nr:ferritin family protein [Deltaproteobacteria bacterium]
MSARDAAVVALGEAVKFESDGRDFYLRAAAEAASPLTRAVLEALAEDERDHVRRVREIYEELKGKPGWPDVPTMVAHASGVLDAFEQASSNLSVVVPPDAEARDVLVTATEMEKKGISFYRERAAKATCAAEEEFFRRLVAEEEVHLHTLAKLRGTIG